MGICVFQGVSAIPAFYTPAARGNPTPSCPLVGEGTLPVVGKYYFNVSAKETKFHLTSPSI